MQEISSTNNAKIKHLMLLQKKSSLRRKTREFVVEGIREIKKAMHNGYFFQEIYYCPDLFPDDELEKLRNRFDLSKTIFFKITRKLYDKIAYRGSTEGVIGIAQMKKHSFDELKLSDNPFLLVAESIEKPGNTGAILRSVDGAGADALIWVNPVTDLYNPNIIRSSLGTVFSNQIVVCDTAELSDFLQQKNIKLFSATLQNSHLYFKENYTGATAIAVGAEDKGLSDEIRKISNQSIYIPMKGDADSLNVSVSAAILLYEVVRQREI